MAIEPIKVWELVDRAVSHKWSVPEFQRGFVWKATQVRDLAESLWLNYPVGSLLIWNSSTAQEEKVARDGEGQSQWIVDGQQRTTALAILFGRKPYWWPSADDWNKTLKRYDIRFDIDAKEAPFFLVANAAIRKARGDRYVPLSQLLTLDTDRDLDQKKLQDLAKAIKQQDLCHGMDSMEVYTRLDRVRRIRDNDLISVTIHHDLEDVVEIFERLNSRGTRVTEADIYLGVVASKNPGWVRESFLPFVKELEDAGFKIEPNLLFRSLTAIGIGRVRFREINQAFWERQQVEQAWNDCRDAWKRALLSLQEFGVLSTDPLPTLAALVTLVALLNRFRGNSNFRLALYWLVQASRFGRYSGSANTSLEEDLKEIAQAESLPDACTRLMRRLAAPTQPVTDEDFRRDYTDGKFWRFLLYLLVYQNGARDWDEHGSRLGFQGTQLLEDFKPQWHHVFPKKFLRDRVASEDVDALANIAVIGPEINIRISNKDPLNYFEKYNIGDDKLRQQFVPMNRNDLTEERFQEFLRLRASALAARANQWLRGLSEGLPDEVRPSA